MTCQPLCYVMGIQCELDGQGPFAQEVDWLVGTDDGVWKGSTSYPHIYLRMCRSTSNIKRKFFKSKITKKICIITGIKVLASK